MNLPYYSREELIRLRLIQQILLEQGSLAISDPIARACGVLDQIVTEREIAEAAAKVLEEPR